MGMIGPYYAGPSPWAAGLGAFGDNFAKMYQQGRENSRADDKLKQEKAQMEAMNALRKQQEQLIMEQLLAAKAERDREKGLQEALRGAAPTPMSEQDAVAKIAFDPGAVNYQNMPTGVTAHGDSGMMSGVPGMKRAAVLTPEAGSAINGMVNPKIDFDQYLQTALPFMKSNEMASALASRANTEDRTKIQDALQKLRENQLEVTTGFKNKELDMKLTEQERRQRQLDETTRHNQVLEGFKGMADSGKKLEEKLDYESGKKLIGALPKMKDEAVVAAGSLEKMKYMVDLMDKGAGGTAGALKAAVAPYAELFGYNPKSLSDAQAFQLAAKTISGSMRMAIIGPGQVSNYEQQLLQSLSGGGNTARAAAKELYALYAKEARDRVNKYNESVDSLAEISPKSKTLWKKINMATEAGKTIKRTGTLNGKKVVEYSDGSVEYGQ